MFYSEEVDITAAEAVLAEIEEKHPDLEIELHEGGPELYPYVMTLE
jgi:dihydroxyacetone kinase-like predicted kinase